MSKGSEQLRHSLLDGEGLRKGCQKILNAVRSTPITPILAFPIKGEGTGRPATHNICFNYPLLRKIALPSVRSR